MSTIISHLLPLVHIIITITILFHDFLKLNHWWKHCFDIHGLKNNSSPVCMHLSQYQFNYLWLIMWGKVLRLTWRSNHIGSLIYTNISGNLCSVRFRFEILKIILQAKQINQLKNTFRELKTKWFETSRRNSQILNQTGGKDNYLVPKCRSRCIGQTVRVQ